MRRLLGIALLLYLVPAAAAQSAAPAPPVKTAPAAGPKLDVPFTQFTLPNGLHVILHEDHTVPLVTVNVWYDVGSAREKPGRTGFAHLFEHLMFMGSKHASTSEDRTNYYIDVPSNALDLALFLESDRMAYLIEAMSPKTVDAQRDVV